MGIKWLKLYFIPSTHTEMRASENWDSNRGTPCILLDGAPPPSPSVDFICECSKRGSHSQFLDSCQAAQTGERATLSVPVGRHSHMTSRLKGRGLTDKQTIVLIDSVSVTVTGGWGSKNPKMLRTSYVNEPYSVRPSIRSPVREFRIFRADRVASSDRRKEGREKREIAIVSVTSGH